MLIVLLSIIFLTPIAGLLLYKHQGKRQLVNLDFVQFIYLFVMTPVLFVWVKSFTYYILKGEVGVGLSVNQVFIVDTVLSVLCFYIFSAIAIHTLTKTFRLHKDVDPLFDLFELSEYFHLWWSHLIIWFGVMALLVFISVVNVFVPIAIEPKAFSALWTIVVGMLLGMILYFSVVVRTYLDSVDMQVNYLRIMKLSFALFFVFHVVVYFLLDPKFNASYAAYWTVLNIFFTTVVCSLVLRHSRFRSIIRRYINFLQSSRIKLMAAIRLK